MRFHEKQRQPAQHEVVGVVMAKVPEARAPNRALREERAVRHWASGPGRRHGLQPAAGYCAPREEPGERDQAECDEPRSPPERRHHEAAHERAKHRTERLAGGDQPVRTPASMHRRALRKQRRVARIRGAFANPEQRAQREQHRKASRKTGERGGGRPECESGRQHVTHAKTLCEPAGHRLQRPVGPKERGKKNSDLGICQTEFVLQKRARRGEIAAVHEVDEDRRGEEQHDLDRKLRWCRRDRFGHGRLYLSQSERTQHRQPAAVRSPRFDRSTVNTAVSRPDCRHGGAHVARQLRACAALKFVILTLLSSIASFALCAAVCRRIPLLRRSL